MNEESEVYFQFRVVRDQDENVSHMIDFEGFEPHEILGFLQLAITQLSVSFLSKGNGENNITLN
jgi:hypothetical protein